MLIDYSYFTGDINVSHPDNQNLLLQAIDQYEKEILIKLLGYELYALLVADLTDGVPQTQIYIDLVDGADFTHEFRDQELALHWEGLKNSAKISLIAYYVFFRFVERDITPYYGSGISFAPKGKDWERAEPVNKLCYVWEKMRELYGKIPVEYKDSFIYPIKGSDMGYVFDTAPSAYNFLYANKDDYPAWIFTPLWNINVFGI